MNVVEARKILQRDVDILIENKSLPDGIEAMKTAIMALGSIDQIRWERDIALEQLGELGISFGEKIDGTYLTKEQYEVLLEYKSMYEDLCK